MKKMMIKFLSVFILISALTLTAFAAESDDVIEQRKQDVINSTTIYKVEYTYDSVVQGGIGYELVIDPFTYLATLTITKDLPFSHVIYDKPDTEIIDGIRVNGETITALKNIPISPAEEAYTITVKVVYAEGIPGLIAKISDGTVTAEELLANPLILLQLLYYVIAALSIIVGGIGVLKSKKKKVKSADEIAALIDLRTKEAQDDMQEKFLALLNESMLPIVQKTVDTNKQIVRAITLSTSKMKDAPVALLDVLKEVSDVNTGEMFESAKDSVIKSMNISAKERRRVKEALESIVKEEEVKEVETEEKSIF